MGTFAPRPWTWLAVLAAVCACTSPPPAEPPSAPPVAAPPKPYLAALQTAGVTVPPSGKFILVNIPAFALVAFQDGAPVLRSRVVVGKPETPTPELETSLYAVTFNPSWTPTPAMRRFEGARFAPPGPANPLGQVLFALDNDALIFMHDTNDRSYFARAQRALSHGCVRVQEARALAAWALDMSAGEISALVRSGVTRSLPLASPIAVSLVYRTRFPEEGGGVTVYPDIYGLVPKEATRHAPSGACRKALGGSAA